MQAIATSYSRPARVPVGRVFGMPEHIEKQLRDAVAKMRDSGKTLYWLAKEAGVQYKTIHRWWNESDCDIKFSTASKMASVLGLSLTMSPPPKPKDKS